MHSRVTIDSRDLNLQYLNIQAYLPEGMQLCKGEFFYYLKNNFGISRLPYNIQLIDLVNEGENTDDLFVNLPVEYFQQWENFPLFGDGCNEGIPESITNAQWHYCIYNPRDIFELTELLHPYDSILKVSFSEAFKAQHPSEIKSFQHKNGREFRPYESYLSYWRAYVIFETVQDCKFIDKYLGYQEGTSRFKNAFHRHNAYWVKNYSATFDRLAFFIQASTELRLCTSNQSYTVEELANFSLRTLSSSKNDLESDMQLLLELYFKWSNEYRRTENSAYKKALKNLKKDIYYLYLWLSGIGMTFDEVIERWSGEHSGECIKSVLDYETFKLTESFTRFASSYSRSMPGSNKQSIADLYPIPEVYSQLKLLDSFKPWNRSFFDLHQSINREGKVNLAQPRILDNLLIITIRTEIVIREICSSCTDSQDPNDLKKVFFALSDIEIDKHRSKVLKAVANNFDKTRLEHRPDDLFKSVCKSPIGKQWSIEQKYFYEKLLIFITARNYFAHHSYKDTELDDHTNTVCRDVLLACLHSLLYLSSYLSKAAD